MGLALALCGVGVVACGGDERQDADEPEGTYPVEIVEAEFPSRQRLATATRLRLEVSNAGQETIPELAITIDTVPSDPASAEATGSVPVEDPAPDQEEAPVASGPFSVLSAQPGLAIPSRPVWILAEGYPKLVGEMAPAGAETALTNTFAFGELEPGDAVDVAWVVTPVRRGAYTVSYRIAAGLYGEAEAVTPDGGLPAGEFVVRISAVPPQTRVNDAGQVVPVRRAELLGQAGARADLRARRRALDAR